METVRLTMAQALVRFLENQYVRYDDIDHRFVRGIFMQPGTATSSSSGSDYRESHALEIYTAR